MQVLEYVFRDVELLSLFNTALLTKHGISCT